MTNVFKCKIHILICSSMCGFKMKASYLVFLYSTCLQAIARHHCAQPDPRTEYCCIDTFPSDKPQPCDPDSHVPIQCPVYGDRLKFTLQYILIWKQCPTNDLIHLQICERNQICMHLHFFLRYFCLFGLFRFYILFHLNMNSLNYSYIYQDGPATLS